MSKRIKGGIEMEEYKIEKGVPLPKGRYPFPTMEVGDSFEFSDSLSSVRSAASYWGRTHGQKFTARKNRCWRVK